MQILKRLSMIMVLLMSGCSWRSYDLVQNGIVHVDLKAPKDVPLDNLLVTKEGDDVVVQGYFGGTRPPDTVTVSLVAPNGETLSESHVRTRRLSRRALMRRFQTRFDGVGGDFPPRGSTLRIIY